MTCVVAALTFGGHWQIFDKISISLFSFISRKIKKLGAQIK